MIVFIIDAKTQLLQCGGIMVGFNFKRNFRYVWNELDCIDFYFGDRHYTNCVKIL